MAVFAEKAITSSGRPVTSAYLVRLFIICLSYANLCFLNSWAEISDHGYDFLRKYTVTWPKVVALTIDILIVAALIWGILYLALASARRLWIRTAKWAGMAGLLLPLNAIRTDEHLDSMRKAYFPHTPVLQILILLLGVAVVLYLLFNWERISTRIASALLILLAPTMPLVVANAAWQVSTGPPASFLRNKPLQPAFPQGANAPHVIWIIFDEWDRALTFRDRPADLLLPEVDRFQGESFNASRVYPPARVTILSVPSLLTGRTFIDSKPRIPSEIMLTYDRARPPVALTTQSTVFSEARHRGFNIGIAGWYFPYCRLFPECTVCSWSSAIGLFGREEFEHPSSVLQLMGQIFARQVRNVPALHRLGIDYEAPVHRELHAASYSQILSDLLRMIIDPRLNLVFVHMNVPHSPSIYRASNNTMTDSPETTYADNLGLVDRTLCDLRHKLEESGMWDASTILLTSDHPLRVKNQYSWPDRVQAGLFCKQTAEVPYLLKMPGQKQGLAYHKPMQEIVTKDLLLAIMDREVTTPQQVAAWLDHNPPRQQ
jgi:hypothetical protein